MPLHKVLLLAAALAVPATALAEPPRPATVKPVQRLADQKAVENHLRAKGFKVRGGVDKRLSDRDGREGRSFPSFTSSFAVGGTNYPFTMVGYKPQSGRSADIKSVIIPLRLNFNFFAPTPVVFEPARAVSNIVASPMYVTANFPNGYGQFGDQMQRAAFWNRMDPGHQWHVRMAPPTVAPTIDIDVEPDVGELTQLGNGTYLGNTRFGFMASQIQTILHFLDLPADVLPIFVTDSATADALGFHDAYTVTDDHGATRLQTYIYTSWLNLADVGPLLADVSTFNHELLEWMNDPFVNNIVPTWAYPPASDPRTRCSGNPFLEVGDPQGNGPTFNDFPTVPVLLGGVTYHLQQLVLWQWFADEVPSSAFGGWYSFPDPTSLLAPAVFCP
jgi:hypothetical protein